MCQLVYDVVTIAGVVVGLVLAIATAFGMALLLPDLIGPDLGYAAAVATLSGGAVAILRWAVRRA